MRTIKLGHLKWLLLFWLHGLYLAAQLRGKKISHVAPNPVFPSTRFLDTMVENMETGRVWETSAGREAGGSRVALSISNQIQKYKQSSEVYSYGQLHC